MNTTLIALVLVFLAGMTVGRMQLQFLTPVAIGIFGGAVIAFHDTLLFYTPLMKVSWQETQATLAWVVLVSGGKVILAIAIALVGYSIGVGIFNPRRAH